MDCEVTDMVSKMQEGILGTHLNESCDFIITYIENTIYVFIHWMEITVIQPIQTREKLIWGTCRRLKCLSLIYVTVTIFTGLRNPEGCEIETKESIQF